MTATLIFLAAAVVAVAALLQHPAFGSLPKGERLARIKQSPNYRNGAFANREETPVITSETPIAVQLFRQFFRKNPDRKPSGENDIKTVKTDLRRLDTSRDQIVWFGHSSYLIVDGGATILVDPVLTCRFPVSLMMKPFGGTDLYTPDDMPDVDFLLITHDHWDHLDYETLRQLNGRIGQVICPLGVGAHLEKWGFSAGKIREMDWDEIFRTPSLTITCLTARHSSGRLFSRNQSLWAAFMIEGRKNIFVSGDGGYGKHFAEIGRRFPRIDLAMLENGQYDNDWRHIHTLPRELPQEIRDLNAASAVPVHNSKFALAKHRWDEPNALLAAEAEKDSALRVTIPTIGKPVFLE